MKYEMEIDVRKALLAKQACFAPLRDDELTMLASLLVKATIKAGTVIVTEGDPVDSFFLIVNGSADVRRIIRDEGKSTVESVATLGPGSSIGLNEKGFYSLTGARTATVVAISDMVLLKLSVATFHGFALMYSHVNEVMRKQASKILGFPNFNTNI